MSGQDDQRPAPNPPHQENTAKQSWDDEGGSLHPDEMKTVAAELAEPLERNERAAYTADEDESDDQPS